jgi:hypothetical protein
MDGQEPAIPRRTLGRFAAGALRQGWRGQSAVELALMMPLLALLLIGAADLGRAFYYYTRLANSVSAGAMFGISNPWAVQPSDCGGSIAECKDPTDDPGSLGNVKYFVKNEANLGLIDTDITVQCYEDRGTTPVAYTTIIGGVTVSLPGDCRGAGSGDTMEVIGRYRFRPLTTQLVGILGSGYTMKKTVRMVIL